MAKGWNGGWVFMLMLVATCSRGAKHAIISRSVESGPAGLGHKRGASCREFHFRRGRTDCEKAAVGIHESLMARALVSSNQPWPPQS